MSDKSSIEWCDATWNVVTGCTDVSPGCTNCYARTFAERWRGTEGHHFENGFDLQIRQDRMLLPLSWKRPRKVFVTSMGDLFHDGVADSFIVEAFAVMTVTPQHSYQLLTKRHGRMRSLLRQPGFWEQVGRQARVLADRDSGAHDRLAGGRSIYDTAAWETVDHLPNCWLGVSVEDQTWANIRIPALLDVPAAVHWISAEPLLGPIRLSAAWIDMPADARPVVLQDILGIGLPNRLGWAVVGGESGRGARPAALDWFRDLRDQCELAGVPYLFKQHGQYRGFLTEDDTDRPATLYVNKETGEALPEKDVPDTGSWSGVWSLGKKRAGRILDGREHNGYPAVSA